MPHNKKYITLFIISLLPIFFFCGNSGCENSTIKTNNPSEENKGFRYSEAAKIDTPRTSVSGIDGKWYYESRIPYGDSIYITYFNYFNCFLNSIGDPPWVTKHWSYRIAASDTSHIFIGTDGDSYKTSRIEKGDSMWWYYHNLATHKDSSVHYALSDLIPKPLNIRLSKDSVDLGWWIESRYTLPRDLYWGRRFWATYVVNGKEERIRSNEGVVVRHFFIKNNTLCYTYFNMNQDSIWTEGRDQEAFKYTYTIQKNGGTYFGDTYKTKTGEIGFNEKFCFSAKDSSIQYVNNAWWSIKFERKINIASVYKQFHEYVNGFKNADTNTIGWYTFKGDNSGQIFRYYKDKDTIKSATWTQIAPRIESLPVIHLHGKKMLVEEYYKGRMYYIFPNGKDTMFPLNIDETRLPYIPYIPLNSTYPYGKFKVDSLLIFPELFYDTLFMKHISDEIEEFENRERNPSNW